MEKENDMEKPHKFDIGEGYGIWEMDGETHRHFPEEFYRAKPGDGAGNYKIGDFVVMRQPSSKQQFGTFVIANVETGDYGGTGLKYKITVHPVGTPEVLGAGDGGRDGYPPAEGCPRSGCPSRGARPSQDNKHTPASEAKDGQKETARARTSYTMKRIALADCKPHADAEAYSCSTEDRAALANSVAEAGVLSPIAVVPDEDGKGWFVIDGIGRMNALVEAGETETEAQVFDLGPMSVAEFVVSKNSMMRKVTTGTRVMAYLKCHEREVLAAADPEKYTQRDQNRDSKGRLSHRAVSHETARDKGWNAKEIAGRIGVSKNDVLAGIELLKATVESGGVEECGSGGVNSPTHNSPTHNYEQSDLFETMDAVLRGETPIRRWKAAACGKVSKTGGKAAADYTAIGARTMVSLLGLWQNWQTVAMDCRAPIIKRFRAALEALPDDFRAVIEETVAAHAETRRRGGKRR